MALMNYVECGGVISEKAEKCPKCGCPEPFLKISHLYALILHQFDISQHNELMKLIQKVVQVSKDEARTLLKVPSVIKENISEKEAIIIIDQLKQIDAQLKLMNMGHLNEARRKQRLKVPL